MYCTCALGKTGPRFRELSNGICFVFVDRFSQNCANNHGQTHNITHHNLLLIIYFLYLPVTSVIPGPPTDNLIFFHLSSQTQAADSVETLSDHGAYNQHGQIKQFSEPGHETPSKLVELSDLFIAQAPVTKASALWPRASVIHPMPFVA